MASQLNDFLCNHPNITMTAEHVNLEYDDTKYPHDNWRITFSYEGKHFRPNTTFKTGLAHRELKTEYRHVVKKERGGYYNYRNSEFIKEFEAMVAWFKPTRPHIADVLYGYLSDARDVNITHQCWCSEFGYDSDSISGLNVYLECQRVRDELIKLFGYTLFEELCSLEH